MLRVAETTRFDLEQRKKVASTGIASLLFFKTSLSHKCGNHETSPRGPVLLPMKFGR
jgi:hypothetical protein